MEHGCGEWGARSMEHPEQLQHLEHLEHLQHLQHLQHGAFKTATALAFLITNYYPLLLPS